MTRSVAFMLLFGGLTMSAASAAEKPDKSSHLHAALWRVSQALVVGANVADSASSWGKYEANPVLNHGAPRFGFGACAIKMAVVAGGLTTQQLVVRKDPRRMRLSTAANLAVTGALSAVAVRIWVSQHPSEQRPDRR